MCFYKMLSLLSKIVNQNIKGVKVKQLKIEMWFCDKDLSSVKLLSKIDDLIKNRMNDA